MDEGRATAINNKIIFRYFLIGEETHDKLPLSSIEEDSQSDTITFHSVAGSACPSQSPYNPTSVEVEHDCYTVDTVTGATSSGSGPSGAREGESEMCGGDVGVMKVGPEKKKEATGMVQANGGWHSLDLVAMICYSKLKQKYRGNFIIRNKSSFKRYNLQVINYCLVEGYMSLSTEGMFIVIFY